MEASTTEGADDDINIVDSPRSPLAPRKRSREPVTIDVIDVDGLSSDDEIVLLEVRPSKDVKRARIGQYESRAVKSEIQDVKPKLEVEETKPKTEDLNSNLGPEGMANGSVLDLWRLGC
ncbi:hypothetical protein BDV93DRAFT_530042 [Ceratobasidium sp. AG-I]|nr:hypothetical protein BDV93DRAFT_530042 [Ceratobasidium sp. AG-I]